MLIVSKFNVVVPLALLSGFLVSVKPAVAAAACESLGSLSLPNTTITLARSVAAGAFAPAKPPSLPIPPAVAYKDLPTFCRVAATVMPTKDSEIKFEVWMPVAGWNGKFVAVGNGGYSGEIWYWSMSEPLSRGYATASTDTGHEGSVMDASFALGHPEKWADFGYRAVHEMTIKAKSIITAYYGQGPRFAYSNGCSTGGRQGLMEAQRFPADFDGIIAGAPANYMTRLSAQFVWVGQAIHKDEASFIPAAKLSALHNAVLQACDARDGVKDGILEDPARCVFDPKVLQCKDADGPACLTSPQVEAARKIYGASVNPRTKQLLYPGLVPGSELGWSVGVGPVTPDPMPLATGIFKFVVFKDPNWNYRTFDFDRDSVLADKADAGFTNAIDPNLKAFFSRGGKLLQYHGWADPGITPLNSINYYKSVADKLGGASKIDDSYRLFMLPGVDHCQGGEGPDRFDGLGALDRWIQQKQVPDQIVVSRIRNGKIDRTRPLCPYPQVAVYKGSGSTDEATNFSCKAQ
jgi:Tannase and feruloyl esterase